MIAHANLITNFKCMNTIKAQNIVMKITAKYIYPFLFVHAALSWALNCQFITSIGSTGAAVQQWRESAYDAVCARTIATYNKLVSLLVVLGKVSYFLPTQEPGTLPCCAYSKAVTVFIASNRSIAAFGISRLIIVRVNSH